MPVIRYAAEVALEGRPELAVELTPRVAFELLVSAACYLAMTPATDTASSLEAVQLLHDLSLELLDDGLDLGSASQEMEDLVWQGKQEKWERQRSIETAIRFVKSAGEVRQVTSAKRRQSLWARWLVAWRGRPQVQPF